MHFTIDIVLKTLNIQFYPHSLASDYLFFVHRWTIHPVFHIL